MTSPAEANTAGDLAPDPAAMAAEIAAAYQAQRTPEFHRRDLPKWTAAVNMLIGDQQLALAEYGVRQLAAQFPGTVYAKNLCNVFDRLPPADDAMKFADDPNKDVQIVRREGSDTVLFLFSGLGHRLGLPLPLIHRWLSRLPASLVYLRDFKRVFYLDGVQSLGDGREATLASLRDIIASLGAQRVACYGNSVGVLPALHYGLDLQAATVLALAGPTNIETQFNLHLRPHAAVSRLDKLMPGAGFDLRRSYAAAERPPRVLFIYGGSNWDDRLHAQNMAGLPSVAFQPIEKYQGHHVIVELIQRDLIGGALSWLVGTRVPL